MEFERKIILLLIWVEDPEFGENPASMKKHLFAQLWRAVLVRQPNI